MVNWEENFSSYDIRSQQFIKHLKFDRLRLVVRYHRYDDDEYVVDQVMTLDNQDITSMIRDRTLERIEKALMK